MPKKIDIDEFMQKFDTYLMDPLQGTSRSEQRPQTLFRQEIVRFCNREGRKFPYWMTNEDRFKKGRGIYDYHVIYKAWQDGNLGTTKYLPKNVGPKVKATKVRVPKFKVNYQPVESNVQQQMPASPVATVAMVQQVSKQLILPTAPPGAYIPSRVEGYVPFGQYNIISSIISSGMFYPAYITGLSGNGKTMMVQQVCAELNRECVRANITIETDEDDLIGGYRLVEGQTVWQDGPVITAMKRGAVLLLDEVDLGSNKLMCLQPVLEGESVFIKKTNELVRPTKGFNIMATANTKGKGSEDGRFIGTNMLNEAFLDRLATTIEQEYPPVEIENTILRNFLENSFKEIGYDYKSAPEADVESDTDFVRKLTAWADMTRVSFAQGSIDEVISTRRLVHICKAYVMFGRNRKQSIALCLNRFDAQTRDSLFGLYSKLDERLSAISKSQTQPDPMVASAVKTASPQLQTF